MGTGSRARHCGLCRHGGQIPWHASAAVAVGPLDSPRLDKELEEIKQEGNWTFETVEGCIRCRKVEQLWPFVDVYTTELHVKDGIDVTQSEDNAADHLAEIRYASEAARKKRPERRVAHLKLYPLKACTFRGSARCRSRPPAPHDLAGLARARLRRRRKTTARPPSINYRTQKRNEVVEVPLTRTSVPLGHPSSLQTRRHRPNLRCQSCCFTRRATFAGRPAPVLARRNWRATTAPSAQPSTSACTTLFAPTTAPSPTTLGPKTTAPAPPSPSSRRTGTAVDRSGRSHTRIRSDTRLGVGEADRRRVAARVVQEALVSP